MDFNLVIIFFFFFFEIKISYLNRIGFKKKILIRKESKP